MNEPPKLPTGQRAARWQASSVPPSPASVFRLTADRDQITLSFGTRPASAPAGTELVIDVSDELVLSPATAKRLAEILGHAVRDYEWKHGSLGGEALPPAPPLQGPQAIRKVSGLTEGMPEEGRRLLGLIESLDVAPVLERSFKMLPGRLLTNRYLWGFKRDSLTEASARRLPDVCAALRMPDQLVTMFREHIGDANIVFFGLEDDDGATRAKAYLEFGDRLARQMATRPDARDPLLIYLGFKWEMDGARRASLARYTCHPGLSARDMVERMREAFYGSASSGSFDIARAMVEQGAARVGEQRFLYFETTEDDNPRHSFDINLYNARLRLEEIYPLLLRACQHFAISSEAFHRAYATVRAAQFGHVTGGIDRHGHDFLSLYFGAQ
jgi:hypothetical protein